MLCTFLTQLQSHPIILASPRDERIIKNLRSVFKRQRRTYKDWAVLVVPQHRKDSAIGMDSSSSSCSRENTTWTAKVRRSIKRSITNHHNHQSDTTSNASTSSLPLSTAKDTTRFFSYRRNSSYMLPEPAYKSIILKYRSEIIAQQFCLIEQTMLQKVTWDELVELRWRKRSSKRQSFVIDLALLEEEGEQSLGVERLIGFFNMVTNSYNKAPKNTKYLIRY